MGPKKRLGRGLDALLGNREPSKHQSGHVSAAAYSEMPVDELTPGRFQPRQAIDDDGLSELAESIQQQGVLQPLLVRAVSGSGSAGKAAAIHEIIAGERRWRAARLAGIRTVPVIVHDLDDRSALAVALIENLQREDLTAIEIAESLKKLTTDFGMTHQEAADAVGRSRSAISNYLRLLDLDSTARDFLGSGQLEMGHARALLVLDADAQARIATTVAKQNLSVRDTEKLVANERDANANERRKPAKTIDLQTRWLQTQFASELGVKVSIRDHGDRKTLAIDFNDLSDLSGSLQKIESLVNKVVDTAGPRASIDSD